MTKYLITSALPYINGVKHLGNLVGSLLPADVHARFRRQTGHEVLFLCGTDEHGTPAELAAATAGQDVAAFCREQHEVQADIYARFGLTFDHFGRTSSASNHELTQHVFRCLDANGFVEEREVDQVWSPADNRFLPDRYVIGTCPHCAFEGARGDQCDGCGRLLDPAELLRPRSAVSGSGGLELRKSRHLFLRQSALKEDLRRWLDTREGWPEFVRSLAAGLISDVRDRCITRDLTWGVPVPKAGFEGKVFYVWFDAPIGYIAAAQDWAEGSPNRDWRSWWTDEDVVRVQCLGKDNVPFHAVSFPASLLGAGGEFKAADVIKGFHWLQYDGGKFSTSSRRGVFTDEALQALPADFWRWWLIANAPETGDVDFTVERFVGDVNKDLGDVFGNLVNRIVRFAAKAYCGAVPENGDASPWAALLAERLEPLVQEIRAGHEALEFRKAAAATRALWAKTNAFIQEVEPWRLAKTDPSSAAAVCRVCLAAVRLSAAVSWSIVPHLSNEVLAGFSDRLGTPSWPDDIVDVLSGREIAGRALAFPDRVLVRKIDVAEASALERRFAGGP